MMHLQGHLCVLQYAMLNGEYNITTVSASEDLSGLSAALQKLK